MKQTLQIVLTILLTFLIPMLTSWLLDWNWIVDSTPRYILVVLLMVVEFLIGAYVLRLIGISIFNENQRK